MEKPMQRVINAAEAMCRAFEERDRLMRSMIDVPLGHDTTQRQLGNTLHAAEEELRAAVVAYRTPMTSISFVYTNWKGETRLRQVVPQRIWFGSTEYHQEPQWLLQGLDVQKDEVRDFALKDIREWDPKTEVPG
jgi:predicted DNA-binding transcriptional regulator YafY